MTSSCASGRCERILNGDLTPVSEYRFGQSIPESFTFSRDGRYLYGSSYYTGVSNIFRYEVATGSMEAVSNAETGLFRPMPLADGRLVVLELHRRRFRPRDHRSPPDQGRECHHLLRRAGRREVPSGQDVAGCLAERRRRREAVTQKGPYVPWRNLEPLEWLSGDCRATRISFGIGYHFNFDDPLQFVSLGITAAYTPSTSLPGKERGHVDITGRYQFWRAELSWNRPDFYDIFGPTKRSRKGYAAKLGYDWEL